MTVSCRSWWRNCAQESDSEILNIDIMEDNISPVTPKVSGIRELISTLELCHHKAEKWVDNIIEAIGSGQTTKGLGTRSFENMHDIEYLWQNVCDALSVWCAGCPSTLLDFSIGSVKASHFLEYCGERSLLKEWQVQRVIERIHSFIRWPRSADDIMKHYGWILECGSEYESIHRNECPEHYKEHDDLWLATVQTTIHNKIDGNDEKLSLAVAIDLLMPCHWNFVDNLEIVLRAIGGDTESRKPFFACSMNIKLAPIRSRMKNISNTLKVFCGDSEIDNETDKKVLLLLGKPTETKRWLAASLDKTIRLQMQL